VNYLLGVGSAQFLDVRTFWFREPIAQPGDLGQGVGFLLDCYVLNALKHGLAKTYLQSA
jgi:hypothetical protein